MTEFSKRVVFTMGGKGGVGKTGVVVTLAEWFQANEIPVTLLDLDTENKARGSLKHFFNGTVTKVDVHTPAGLDAFVDHLDGGTPIILADMGAGPGQRRECPGVGESATGSGGVRHRRERYECAGGFHVLAFNEAGKPVSSSILSSYFADGISPGRT